MRSKQKDIARRREAQIKKNTIQRIEKEQQDARELMKFLEQNVNKKIVEEKPKVCIFFWLKR